jgi:pimeloyl-ACP methyl ester carboxylesterase
MWDPFVERFSQHYRVIAADLRGHGGSTNPDGVWTTRQSASDVFALLEHLEVDDVKAVGASAGAMTLLRMATRQPDRFEALVVIGVGTYIPSECRQILAPTTTDGLPEAAWERLRAKHRHGDDQIRALYAWVASLADDHSDMVFIPPLLATITAPTLVVHGDRDYCFPASMAWDIYQAIPDAALWVVPHGGHVPITGGNADRFADTTLEFFATAGSSE